MNDAKSNILQIWQAKELANLDWAAGTQETQEVIRKAVETYRQRKPSDPSSATDVLDQLDDDDNLSDDDVEYLLGYMISEKLTPILPVPPDHWVRCSDQKICEAVENFPRLYDDNGNQILPEETVRNAQSKKAVRDSPKTAEDVLRRLSNSSENPNDMYKMNMYGGGK